MDLWDVIKLMARRWYASAPLLVASFASAIWIGVATEPDYVATSHVTLLPPTVRTDEPASDRVVNPWTVDTLMGAVVTRLNSKSQHDKLAAEGLSDIWEANPDIQFREQLALEVTADSEEEARATTQRLHEIVIDEVNAEQERYPLRSGEEITAVPFDQGENVAPAYKKIYRAMIAVAGAGMVTTFGLVIALDALLRWRSSREAVKPSAGPLPTKKGRSGPVAEERTVRIPARAVPRKPGDVRLKNDAEETAIVSVRTEAAGKSSNGASAEAVVPASPTPNPRAGQSAGEAAPPVAMEMRFATEPPPAPSAPGATTATGDKLATQSEATIVLPLTNALRAGRDNQPKEHPDR